MIHAYSPLPDNQTTNTIQRRKVIGVYAFHTRRTNSVIPKGLSSETEEINVLERIGLTDVIRVELVDSPNAETSADPQ